MFIVFRFELHRSTKEEANLIDSGSPVVPSFLRSMFDAENRPDKRMTTLNHRNRLLKPHLQSSYPVEALTSDLAPKLNVI